MKPSLAVAVFVIVAVATLLLRRQQQLGAEVESLRSAVAAASKAARSDLAENFPSSPKSRGRHPDAEAIHSDPAPTQQARLEALEAKQREIIDSLNWTTEQVNRTEAMREEAIRRAESSGGLGAPVVDGEQATRRAWGEEQATGEPDTTDAGDLPTAWAPAGTDDGEEWLHLVYDQTVEIAQVRVRETLNPGAITRVSAILNNGNELTLWQGTENAGPAPYDSVFNVPRGIVANNVKVYLDTRHAPGWEEIDAVELIGRSGTRQWAKSASASSTYASR